MKYYSFICVNIITSLSFISCMLICICNSAGYSSSLISYPYSLREEYEVKNDYGFFQLLLGIGLFIVFLKAKITYRPWINTVASTTFGIYLLHDNKLFLHHMWDNIFATYQYYESTLLPVYAIVIVALIFIVGMVVDYMRLIFIEKPVMKVLTPNLECIQTKVKQLC